MENCQTRNRNRNKNRRTGAAIFLVDDGGQKTSKRQTQADSKFRRRKSGDGVSGGEGEGERHEVEGVGRGKMTLKQFPAGARANGSAAEPRVVFVQSACADFV